MQSTTFGAPSSEQPGSQSITRFRELLQLAHDTGADQRARAILTERDPSEPPGTLSIREYPDGSIYFGWTAPLSEWLKMRPAPLGGGES